MRPRLIAIAIGALAVAAAMALGIRSSDSEDRKADRYETRTATAGDVTVKATLRSLDADGATAQIVFDTHAVELDLDVAADAVLTVGGARWRVEGWRGAGPGGHHREGELRFAATGPTTGDVILSGASPSGWRSDGRSRRDTAAPRPRHHEGLSAGTLAAYAGPASAPWS
jgi:hypothetical protein